MNSPTDIDPVGIETVESAQPTDLRSVSNLSLRVVTEESIFFSIRDKWNHLVLESAATIYQTHEWTSLWWKYFGKQAHRSLYCILLEHDDILVGIIPLYQERISVLGIPIQRRLGMMGEGTAFSLSSGMFLDNGPSDYLDVIIHPGYELLVGEAVAKHFLIKKNNFDLIDLVNAPEDGKVLTAIVPNLRAHGLACTVSKADVCPYLLAPASVEKYLNSLSSSVRRRLSQARRAATGSEAMYTLSNATTLQECRNGLENIINLHQRRWNRIGYPGLFADHRFRDFQYDLLHAFYDSGWIWCKTATSGDTCVAARLAFKFNGTFYDYLSGFDDEAPAAKRRPGLALLLDMIEDGSMTSSRTIDFLRGDEPYKFEMTPLSRYNWNVTVQNTVSRSKALSGIQQIVRWIRFGNFLISREWSLLNVQYRQHGLLTFIVSYLQFRIPHLKKKLNDLHSTPLTNSPQE